MLPNKIPGFFKARRDQLMAANPNAAFVMPAWPESLRNWDVPYAFRQESNFYYLTGFEEPEAFLILAPAGSQPSRSGNYRMILFVRRRDPEKEMWIGARYGVEGAMEVFGADEAYPIDELDQRLPGFFAGVDKVFYRLGLNEPTDRRIITALDNYRKSLGRSGRGLLQIADPFEVISEMRLFKSADEIEILRKSCKITALAHKAVMREVRPGMIESDVEALIDFHFRKGGCQRVGFGSIIGGGKNAACLHYTQNNEPLRDGELVLIDAGGEYNYYAADITRTFPIGCTFTEGQASVYDVVLKSQTEAISMAKPGVTLADLHNRVCEVMTDGLLSLGILKGRKDEIIKTAGFRRFFPHNTSHWLGIDVHDAGFYQQNGEARALQPGMVFTVEPGFYVQPADIDLPAQYRNIGIRIEDDILITENGYENLTKDAPKTREDIEALKD